MRITAIELTNWLAHRHLMLPLTPLTIVAGPNRAGKSCIADAVPFALTGDLCRATVKGNRKRLLSDGAAKGTVKVSFDGNRVLERDIPTGRPITAHGFITDAMRADALAYVTDARAFARVSPDDRRALLQVVLRADPTLVRVGNALAARGVAADLLAQLRAAHTGDIDNWRTMAREGAAVARADWKRVTGEVYGAVKAEGWMAPETRGRPAPEKMAAAEKKAAQAVEAARDADRAEGAADVDRFNRKVRHEELTRLREDIAQLPALEATVKTVNQAERDVYDEHARVERRLAGMLTHSGPEAHCPHCGGLVIVGQGGQLTESTSDMSRPSAATIASARALLAELDQQRKQATHTREQTEGRVGGLRAKKDRLLEVEAQAAAHAAAGGGQGDPREAAIAAQAAARDAAAEHLALVKHMEEADASEAATKKAARQHDRVESWSRIATLIAIDGIPGEILLEAMNPLLDDLRTVAMETGWPQVSIDPGMAVTADGRAYELLSESEQWRVDTALAVVLARISGLRFAVLDRFDVLDIPSRKPTMGWLYKRVQAGDLETCILIGTMKEPPQAPKAVSVVWLGDKPGASQQKAA